MVVSRQISKNDGNRDDQHDNLQEWFTSVYS